MDTESPPNLAESHVLTETPDKDIYQAVIHSIATQENIELNSGDKVNMDIYTH